MFYVDSFIIIVFWFDCFLLESKEQIQQNVISWNFVLQLASSTCLGNGTWPGQSHIELGNSGFLKFCHLNI